MSPTGSFIDTNPVEVGKATRKDILEAGWKNTQWLKEYIEETVADLLSDGGEFAKLVLAQGSAPTAASGKTIYYMDSATHRLKVSVNGGSFIEGLMPIKSIQRVTVTIPTNTTNGSQSITTVDPAKTMLTHLGTSKTGGTGASQQNCAIGINSGGTSVTAETVSSVHAGFAVNVQIVEFY